MNPETTSRRERERETHRLQIMDAAEAIFSARGYNAVTVEDIAEKAGFAVGSIYNFFGGKQDLFDQVLLRIAQNRIDDIEQRILPVEDKWEGLRLMCGLWMAHHERHQAFLHIAIGAKLSGGIEKLVRNETVHALAIKYHGRELEFFESFAALPDVRPFSPEECLHVFDGVARSLLFHRGARDLVHHLAANDTRPLDVVLFELLEKIFRK